MILEEAAYCDEGFFYETVAPILSVGSASLVAISTLTSEINFYTRLIKMLDPATGRPLFVTRSIELCCDRCKEEGKSHECVHMLHLVPSWQSQERHRKLHVMMQDRPDLIKSELAGLAFDSLQQIFRKCDIAEMFAATPLPLVQDQPVWLVIDPAAGGPGSDYAIVSLVRHRGCVTVRAHTHSPHSRDAVPLPARLHERRHRLPGAKELQHQLLSQVQQEPPDPRTIPDIKRQHPCFQARVNIQQQVKNRQQLRVRRARNQRPHLRHLRVRRFPRPREKLGLQRRQRALHHLLQPPSVQHMRRLLQHIHNLL